MPRPCKQRRVCGHPPCGRFGPAGQDAGPEVVMGVDEFEAIRLIDLEGLTQEECAAQMNVARTTVQAIYAQARVKLARCLVGGCALSIRGGDYATRRRRPDVPDGDAWGGAGTETGRKRA